MSRRAELAGLALVAVAGAGCATVPSRSEPVSVRTVHTGDVAANPDVHIEPRPARTGMSVRAIVRGFLDASSEGVEEGHRVARTYLTAAAADSWQDDTKAVIYDGDPDPYVDSTRSSLSSTALASLSVIAAVNPDGSYEPRSESKTVTFRLSRERGQWRIENPPSGLLVRASEFDSTYQKVPVYFLNADETKVVADPRYFPIAPVARANRAVQALLDGPSRWLGPAVRTEVPPQTSLRRGVVASGTGPIDVDLGNLGPLDDQRRRGLVAQIVSSVGPLVASSRVRVLDDGKPLQVTGWAHALQTSDLRSYDPDTLPESSTLYAVRDGAAITQTGEAVPGPAGAGDYSFSSLAVSVDATRMAGITHRADDDQLRFGQLGHNLPVRLTARSLTTPTFGYGDRYAWTVRNGSTLLRVPRSGPVEVVSAPALAPQSPSTPNGIGPVSELRIFRDGTQAVIVGNGGNLYVGRLAQVGGRTMLDKIRNITPGRSGFTAVGWAAADKIYGLAPSVDSLAPAIDSVSPVVGSASLVPWTVAVDGSSSSSDPVAGLPKPPVAVAAAPEQLTVASAGDHLYYFYGHGNRWEKLTAPRAATQTADGITGSAPVYPD